MPTRDHYMTVARQIADYLNSFGLAFKTYKISEFDDMIRAVAGEGARVSTDTAARDFTSLLQERGFVIFPSIDASPDGYVRVFRSNTVIANILSAFRYPGPNGDAQLAGLLRTLQSRRRPDDFSAEGGAESS
jgi:hypothetical protein